MVNTQSARHFPSTVVWTSPVFSALASLAWPVLYAQVGVGSFCVIIGARHATSPQTLNNTTTVLRTTTLREGINNLERG